MTVEIDESAVSRRKFNRGRLLSTLWCVGGVCRETREEVFETTTIRSKINLHKILENNVNKESHIITDEWKGYSGFHRAFNRHNTVCHKKEFINENNKLIHTETI